MVRTSWAFLPQFVDGTPSSSNCPSPPNYPLTCLLLLLPSSSSCLLILMFCKFSRVTSSPTWLDHVQRLPHISLSKNLLKFWWELWGKKWQQVTWKWDGEKNKKWNCKLQRKWDGDGGEERPNETRKHCQDSKGPWLTSNPLLGRVRPSKTFLKFATSPDVTRVGWTDRVVESNSTNKALFHPINSLILVSHAVQMQILSMRWVHAYCWDIRTETSVRAHWVVLVELPTVIYDID